MVLSDGDQRERRLLPSQGAPFNATEPLGVSAPEPAQPTGLARLRGHRRDLLPSLERPHGHARADRFHHPPRMGQTGHRLRPLVLIRKRPATAPWRLDGGTSYAAVAA